MDTTNIPEDLWHYRGILPHLEQQKVQVLTFRLYDSVPSNIIKEWKILLSQKKGIDGNLSQINRLKKQIDQYEDAGHGKCFLQDSKIAKIMEDTLFYNEGKKYNLIRWCIMPNHVHVLMEVFDNVTISSIMYQWKSYTAHQANAVLKRDGIFWMQEYHDRFVRDIDDFCNVVNYIDNNPVKAGLAQAPSDWRWSSAYHELHNPELVRKLYF